MKSKIASFINTLMTLLILGLICFLGIIIYNQFFQESVVDDVQQFVSNYTITGKDISENINQYNIEQEKIELDNSNDNTKKINKYFYNQLNDYSKSIYDSLEKNRENMKTGTYEINFGTEFSELLSSDNGTELLGNYFQSAIESYTYDNPDIFYINYGKLYLNIETTTRMLKKTYRVFINSGDASNYLTEEFPSKEKIDEAIEEIEKVKAYFIQNKKLETYDNIKLVHDYLVDSIEYDQYEIQENSHNIYGAIVNKQCVCEGYAKAFKYLLDSLNIPCVIVIGEATDNENNTESHAWNYVELNNIWYAVDCTWDDPIIEGYGFLTNSSKYKYFLKGEREFTGTHMPNGQFTENGKIFTYPTLSTNNY